MNYSRRKNHTIPVLLLITVIVLGGVFFISASYTEQQAQRIDVLNKRITQLQRQIGSGVSSSEIQLMKAELLTQIESKVRAEFVAKTDALKTKLEKVASVVEAKEGESLNQIAPASGTATEQDN